MYIKPLEPQPAIKTPKQIRQVANERNDDLNQDQEFVLEIEALKGSEKYSPGDNGDHSKEQEQKTQKKDDEKASLPSTNLDITA